MLCRTLLRFLLISLALSAAPLPPWVTAAAAKELQQLRDKVRKLEAEPAVSMQSESLTGAAAKQRLNE
eukprot:524657-Pyramimonas_sp.AAC.1